MTLFDTNVCAARFLRADLPRVREQAKSNVLSFENSDLGVADGMRVSFGERKENGIMRVCSLSEAFSKGKSVRKPFWRLSHL